MSIEKIKNICAICTKFFIYIVFLGSDTTAVACKNQNRNYIGIEVNPKWYKVAKNRLEGCNANGQTSFILK